MDSIFGLLSSKRILVPNLRYTPGGGNFNRQVTGVPF